MPIASKTLRFSFAIADLQTCLESGKQDRDSDPEFFDIYIADIEDAIKTLQGYDTKEHKTAKSPAVQDSTS